MYIFLDLIVCIIGSLNKISKMNKIILVALCKFRYLIMYLIATLPDVYTWHMYLLLDASSRDNER